MTSVSATQLRQACAGNLHGWCGLRDLSLTDAFLLFPRDSDWSGNAQLGRRHQAMTYVWCRVPGSDRSLRIWSATDRVALIDMAWTVAVDSDADHLAGLLGEVPIALDTWQGPLPLAKAEHVFAQHGLAVWINPETRLIWHLALFAPQSLEDYLNNLRIDMQVSRHPAVQGQNPDS